MPKQVVAFLLSCVANLEFGKKNNNCILRSTIILLYVYYSLSKKVTFNEIDPFYEDPVTNSCSLQNGSHIETSSKLLSELYVTDPEFDENNIKVYDQ